MLVFDPANWILLTFLFVWTVILFGPPLFVPLLIVRRVRPGAWLARNLGRALIRGVFKAYLCLVGAYVVWIGPWRGGVVAAGRLSDGRDYCIVQRFQDLAEPFRVSLFVRNDARVWKWYYLDHEDNGWMSGGAELDGRIMRVRRNGVPFRDVAIDTAAINVAALPPEERYAFRAASYSPELLAVTR